MNDIYTGLFPYQCEGVDFLAERKYAFLLDSMGLGKSIQAIRAADKLNLRHILVICPAIAQTHWQREFDKFGLVDRQVRIVSYNKAAQPSFRQELSEYQLLVLDEAHFLKNRTAKRTKAIYQKGIANLADRIWLLTGTPTPNNSAEIWTHLRTLLPSTITFNGKPLSYWQFVDKFCETRPGDYGPIFIGHKPDIRALKERMKPHTLRRHAEDVLKDLPPISFHTHVLTGTPATIEAEYDAVNVEGLIKLPMSTLRRELGLAKAPVVAGMLDSELFEGSINKVVVFAHHLDVIAELDRRLAAFQPAVVKGSTLSGQRQRCIDRFQTDPRCRVFIGQIQAASTAITLTAANQVVFAEQSWTPADNLQAAKRCHRIGQTKPVFARFITLAGSLDEAITAVLTRKTRLIAELEE